MQFGGGGEPHHFPELNRLSVDPTPPKKSSIVLVALGGGCLAALVFVWAQFVTVRFFGDQTPITAAESLLQKRLNWAAFAVLVTTIAATVWMARRAKIGFGSWFAVTLLGVIGGIVLAAGAVLGWFG